jgi:hypothetical protein
MTANEQRIVTFKAKSKHYQRIAAAAAKGGQTVTVTVEIGHPGFTAHVGMKFAGMDVFFDAQGRFRGYWTSAGVRCNDSRVRWMREAEETIMVGDWRSTMRPSERAAKVAAIEAA